MRDATQERQHSTAAISRHFYGVLKTILVLYPELVRAPPDIIPEAISKHRGKMLPLFKNVRGALDGSYIPISILKDQSGPWRN